MSKILSPGQAHRAVERGKRVKHGVAMKPAHDHNMDAARDKARKYVPAFNNPSVRNLADCFLALDTENARLRALLERVVSVKRAGLGESLAAEIRAELKGEK